MFPRDSAKITAVNLHHRGEATIFNVQEAFIEKIVMFFFHSLERLNIKAHEEGILIRINLFFRVI